MQQTANQPGRFQPWGGRGWKPFRCLICWNTDARSRFNDALLSFGLSGLKLRPFASTFHSFSASRLFPWQLCRRVNRRGDGYRGMKWSSRSRSKSFMHQLFFSLSFILRSSSCPPNPTRRDLCSVNELHHPAEQMNTSTVSQAGPGKFWKAFRGKMKIFLSNLTQMTGCSGRRALQNQLFCDFETFHQLVKWLTWIPGFPR